MWGFDSSNPWTLALFYNMLLPCHCEERRDAAISYMQSLDSDVGV